MKRKLNKKKVITFIFIILLLILSIVSIVLYKKNSNVRIFFDEYIFRKNITENTLPTISIDNANVFVFDDNIICLEKNVLTFFNKSGTKLSSLDLEISNPIFEANDNFLCIAENNGSKLYLIYNKNILWQKDIDGEISNLTVNKNGYVAVSISNTTHKTVCKLYNNDGDELFTTYHSETYVIDSVISDDNKFLALAETNFSGITIQSNIKIVSIEKALSGSTDAQQYNYCAPINSFIININYINNKLVCIYDNHIDIIENESITEIANFDENNILFSDINNKLIKISKINSSIFSSKFELNILDIVNNNTKTYSLDREPKSLDVYGNIIAVNFGTEILFINNNGWLVKNYTSSQEIQDVVLSNKLAGIIFKDKVEILSF